MAKNKIKFETFLDGLCGVWRLDDKQRPVPVIKNMRFKTALSAPGGTTKRNRRAHKVERLIRIPRADQVEPRRFCKLSAENSTALRKRRSSRTRCPKCTDLTLEQPELLLDFDDWRWAAVADFDFSAALTATR